MALHKHFREYTDEEITKIKKDICAKHKCPYLNSISHVKIATKKSLLNKCCFYTVYSGHSRGCMPDECEHWKDKNVRKTRFNEDYIY